VLGSVAIQPDRIFHRPSVGSTQNPRSHRSDTERQIKDEKRLEFASHLAERRLAAGQERHAHESMERPFGGGAALTLGRISNLEIRPNAPMARAITYPQAPFTPMAWAIKIPNAASG